MRRILILVTLALLGAALTGCSEREQTTLYKDGKYRGKPDARPWESADAGWKKGDRESWQNQIRTRSDGQNENRRIGH